MPMMIASAILGLIIALGLAFSVYCRIVEKRENDRIARMSPSEKRKYQEEM